MVIIGKDQYLKIAQLFYWANCTHYAIWFTGSDERHPRSEVMLKRLAETGKLQAYQPNKFGPKYYAALRVKNTDVEHGLGCTEGLVRFWRADQSGTIIPARYFRGLGSVPEWGIRYESDRLLLFEYCTADNFRRVLKTKLGKYGTNIYQIEERFSAQCVVVFVCDVSRERVRNFITRYETAPYMYFTDYTTFKQVEIGKALISSVYLWEGGKEFPLRDV